MIWLLGILLISILIVFVQNLTIKINEYTVTIPNLHRDVRGKKIVHLSDIHLRPSTRKSFLESIIEKIKLEDPDLIVITGDLVQAGLDDFIDTPVRFFAESLSEIAPTYFVTGNHDIFSGNFEDLIFILHTSGVKVLIDEAEWISFGNGEAGIVLMGLAERSNTMIGMTNRLKSIELTSGMNQAPRILLAHHPEFFEDYLIDETKAPTLTLAGHTHGGQFKFPLIGGIYAPGQGFFPKYDYGLFANDTVPYQRMIISSGLGRSSAPFRMNNQPEIIVITLQ